MSSLTLSITRIKLTLLRTKICIDLGTIMVTKVKTTFRLINTQMMKSLKLKLLKFKYHNQRATNKRKSNSNFNSNNCETNTNTNSWNSSSSCFHNSIRNKFRNNNCN